MACTFNNVCQEKTLLWFISYSMMYLFIWLYTLYIYEKYLVSEKCINQIKVKQFVRKKSDQKTNESRRNKMMSRVRLIRKIHAGHPAFSFHTQKWIKHQRANTSQLYDSQSPKDKNNPILKRTVTISSTDTFLLWLHVTRTLDGIFWGIISKISFCTVLQILKTYTAM